MPFRNHESQKQYAKKSSLCTHASLPYTETTIQFFHFCSTVSFRICHDGGLLEFFISNVCCSFNGIVLSNFKLSAFWLSCLKQTVLTDWVDSVIGPCFGLNLVLLHCLCRFCLFFPLCFCSRVGGNKVL